MTCAVCQRETSSCDFPACPGRRAARRETRRIGKGGLVFMAVWVAVCLLVALWASISLADEGPKCGERAALVAGLEALPWQERKAATWIDQFGNMVELYGNDGTGTATQIVTAPGQPSCMVSIGQGFQLLPQGDPA